MDLKGQEIGDLRISGSLTAQQYIISSSVTNVDIATLSGSTNFGDTPSDRHSFTGSIHVSASRQSVIAGHGGLKLLADQPSYPRLTLHKTSQLFLWHLI